MRYIFILVAFILVACSSTGVVPMDSGTYMIAKRSAQVGFGPPDGVKADVYREANDFCAKKQKNDGIIAEDILKKLEKNIQELTDKYCKEADDLSEKKEKEVITI